MSPLERHANALRDALGPRVLLLKKPLPPHLQKDLAKGLNEASQALAKGDLKALRAAVAYFDHVLDRAGVPKLPKAN